MRILWKVNVVNALKDAGNGVESSNSRESYSARIYIKRKDADEELGKLHQANTALAELGIHLSVGPSRNQDRKNFLTCVLNVHIDHEISSRGAGRHAEDSGYTLEDVEQMIAEGLSPQQIAEKLGMSLATYYRRRKKAATLKEKGHNATRIPF